MTGPEWDEDIRWRVQEALNKVLRTAADIVMRRSDPYGGFYVVEQIRLGDVTGTMNAGRNLLLEPLQAAIDNAKTVLAQVTADLDNHKREMYGPNHRPTGRN